MRRNYKTSSIKSKCHKLLPAIQPEQQPPQCCSFVSFGILVFGDDADCDEEGTTQIQIQIQMVFGEDADCDVEVRGLGVEGNFGGCWEMMKGPRGDRPTPRSAQITISTKINFASLLPPPTHQI